MNAYRYNEWCQLIGAFVEIRQSDNIVRSGFVDDATHDSSALWLAADGFNGRAIFEAAQGHVVWVEPQELEGKRCYQMTASLLDVESQIQPARGCRTGLVTQHQLLAMPQK